MANNSSIPYFTWFAEESKNHPGLKLSFIAMHNERPRMLDEMPAKGCDAYWIPFDQGSRKKSMLRAVPKLYKLFRKIKPDIIHSTLFDDTFPSLIAARLAGVKHRVATRQDTGFHWYFAPKAKIFDRIDNKLATHIVAVSNECRDFLIENEKADSSKITLIHHGIDIEELTKQSDEKKQRLRERFGLDGKTVIGTLARLIEWKGYRYIIEAAETIVKQFPDARFLFIGTGDQKSELEALVKQKQLGEHIIFTGWIDRADTPSLYGIMDVYLHAAFMEPFGFVIPEAMVNAIPVVSTSTGSARDAITHMKNGYLTSYHNSQELAQGVLFMLNHPDRKAIGEEGKKTAVKMYNSKRMWTEHYALYKKLFEAGK